MASRVSKIRGVLIWLGLAVLFLLAGLSVFGAFLGAQRAKNFFNSIPLAIFWLFLAELLLVSLIDWRNRKPKLGVITIHLGTLLIICGAMWGSQYAHKLRALWMGENKMVVGQVSLQPGQQAKLHDLNIKLEKAWVEYYPPTKPTWDLFYETRSPDTLTAVYQPIIWQVGEPVELGRSGIKMTVKRYVTDEANPIHDGQLAPPVVILEVSLGDVGGELMFSVKDNVVTARLPLIALFDSESAWSMAGAPSIVFDLGQAVKDYKAELSISDTTGGQLAHKVIEVNDPLQCGGYHFYLTESDGTGQNVTIMLRSDSGLWIVFTGFGLLMLGLVINMWLSPAWRASRLEQAVTLDTPREEEGQV